MLYIIKQPLFVFGQLIWRLILKTLAMAAFNYGMAVELITIENIQ